MPRVSFHLFSSGTGQPDVVCKLCTPGGVIWWRGPKSSQTDNDSDGTPRVASLSQWLFLSALHSPWLASSTIHLFCLQCVHIFLASHMLQLTSPTLLLRRSIYISLFLFSLCQVWDATRNALTASSDSLFHHPLSLVFFFQSSSSPAFVTSLLTHSSHLRLGLPRLLPSSRNYAALVDSLSSAILSPCPVHCSLLLNSFSVKLLCTPVSSLNSTIILLPALVTLAIFRTQLFSHTCSLCCGSSVIPMFPFRTCMPVSHKCSWPCPLVFLRSADPPSPHQLLYTRSLRPLLFDIPLSLYSRLHTLPLLDT